MVTKSKNDRAAVWSIFALVVAAVSIVYCFSHIIDLVSNGAERSSRAIAYLARLMKGGTL